MMDRELRHATLAAHAVAIVRANGFNALTARTVADRAGISVRSVNRWAGGRKGLRRKTLEHARVCGAFDVIDAAISLGI